MDDVLDLRLEGDALGGPVKVPDLKSQVPVREVSSHDSNLFNSFLAELSVGDESGGFECALLLVNGHSASGESSFVS